MGHNRSNGELNYPRINYRFEKITLPLHEFQVASHVYLESEMTT